MNKRRIQGVVVHYRLPGSTDRGYRPIWEMGQVADNKKRTRIKGINRPST